MGVEQELELVNYFSPPVDVLHILQDDRNGVYVRVRLFRVKMISGNHFHNFPHVWLSRKMIFFEK